MREKALILGILIGTFVSFFYLTTLATEIVCHYNGYYQQGIDDERELFNG